MWSARELRRNCVMGEPTRPQERPGTDFQVSAESLPARGSSSLHPSPFRIGRIRRMCRVLARNDEPRVCRGSTRTNNKFRLSILWSWRRHLRGGGENPDAAGLQPRVPTAGCRGATTHSSATGPLRISEPSSSIHDSVFAVGNLTSAFPEACRLRRAATHGVFGCSLIDPISLPGNIMNYPIWNGHFYS